MSTTNARNGPGTVAQPSSPVDKCKDEDYALIKRALSPARFESHRASNFDSDEKIAARYLWNGELAESFYRPLQILEIVYRNAMDSAIREKDKNWLMVSPGWFQPYATDSLDEARASLKERSTRPLTHDRIVQELSFGFWTSLLNSKYETLFHGIGEKVFPALPSRTRKVASVRFENIRSLRNRIFHFRRIWNRPNLKKDYTEILETIDWINSNARRLLLATNSEANFDALLTRRP